MRLYDIYGHLYEDAYDDAKVSFAKKFPDVDAHEIEKYTDLYKSKHQSILKKKELPPEAKNINGWAGKKCKKSWDEFKQFIDSIEVENSNRSTQKADTGNEGDFIDVWEDNNWRVLMPLDHTAAIHFGKYTTWCTTKPGQSHFAAYVFKERKNLLFCLNKKDPKDKFAIVFDNRGYVSEVRDPMQTDNAQSLYDKSGLPRIDDLVEMAVGNGKSDYIDTKRAENTEKDLLTKVEICIRNNKRDDVIERRIQAEQNALLAIMYKEAFKDANINIRTSAFNHAIFSGYNEATIDSIESTESFIETVKELYPEKNDDPNFCFGNEKIKQARDNAYVNYKQRLIRIMKDEGHLGELDYAPELIKNDPEVIEVCKSELIKNIVKGIYYQYTNVPKNIQNDKDVLTAYKQALITEIKGGAISYYIDAIEELKKDPDVKAAYKQGLIISIKYGDESYDDVPEEFKDDPEVKDAYKQSLIAKIKDGSIFYYTQEHYHDELENFKKDPDVKAAYKQGLMKNIKADNFNCFDVTDEFSNDPEFMELSKNGSLRTINGGNLLYYKMAPKEFKNDPEFMEVAKHALIRNIKRGINVSLPPKEFKNDPEVRGWLSY